MTEHDTPASRATSHDVARLAGVSQTTVSRTFRSVDLVSEATRQRVFAAAGELGYRPHVLARSLITGRSNIIGVVVALEDAEYYAVMMAELSRALQPRRYHILTFMAADAMSDPDRFVQSILDYRVDGLVIGSIGMSSDLTAQCAAAGVPVVLYNRTQDDPRFSSVTTDNAEGGRILADLLVRGGHRRIAYLAGREDSSTNRDREAGFCEQLRRLGRELSGRAVGNYARDEARAAAHLLLGRDTPDRPDAVFAASDHMAIEVMEVARHELGLRVPEDLSVVGYDDIPQAAAPSYALTTVRQPNDQMVSETVRLLMEHIEGNAPEPTRVVIGGRLVIRRSARLACA